MDERRGGGAKHSSPTALWLGIGVRHSPKISEFCLGLGGAQKCFILRDQTKGDLKSHHLQARVTLTVCDL